MKQFNMQSLDDTKKFAQQLATYIKPPMLLTLCGDLGAGKTTFTKALGTALGVSQTINSPTFTILKIYQGKFPIYHIDAYRLEGIQQELGFEEVFEDDGLCIVEWPEFIKDQLPNQCLEIKIELIENEERLFTLQAIGEKYEKIVEAVT